MSVRTFGFIALYVFTVSLGMAQQADTSAQELQLNLDQFPDTQALPEEKELELNLEQFDKTNSSGNAASDDDLKINLEQFDNNSQVSGGINSNTSDATRVEKADSPLYNHRRIFLVGGLVFLVFLYMLSRRRKR